MTGAAIDQTSGFGGHTFTLSLSRIWELALTRMCEDLSAQTRWTVEPRSESVRLWDDACEDDAPYRPLIADTLLRSRDQRWVLDAKYKLGFGAESRNDRFQMCAYALGFSAVRTTLVYPFSPDHLASPRILLDRTYGNHSFTIDAVALPMSDGPPICKQQLLMHIIH